MRTLDATAFNLICRDAEVRPWLGLADPTAEIDLTPQISNPDNFAFLTDQGDGGYVLLKLQAGLYAAHTLALPAARGRPMLKLMRSGFRTMFTCTDAIEIVTQIPDGNVAAKGWSDLAGFKDTYRREAFFPLMGDHVGCQFRSLSYQDWALHDKENRTLGQQFHAAIHGLGLADHPEDFAHDHMVGATIACAQNQNVIKGVGLFNRWAVAAGYQQAAVRSATPPTVDTGDALLSILNGTVEVLQVRSVRSTPLDS